MTTTIIYCKERGLNTRSDFIGIKNKKNHRKSD